MCLFIYWKNIPSRLCFFPITFEKYTNNLFLPKVAGERYVYKFVCDPEALFSMAFPDNQRPVLKTDLERQINEEDTVPLSHFDENMAYVQDAGYCNPHPYSEGYVY